MGEVQQHFTSVGKCVKATQWLDILDPGIADLPIGTFHFQTIHADQKVGRPSASELLAPACGPRPLAGELRGRMSPGLRRVL